MKRMVLLLSALCAAAASAQNPPRVAVVRLPAGMTQLVGGLTARDNFVLANAGPGTASVTVAPNRSLFQVTPSSFTIAEGATATVEIRPTVNTAGFYEAVISIDVAGVKTPLTVPVRLLIGSAPQGTVAPVPSTNTLILSGLSGTQHSGSIRMTNQGNVGMQCVLIPGASWIAPQSGVVNVGASGSMNMPFVVDPAQRPDSIAPLGAIAGNMSMIWIKGTSPNVSETGTVNVTVYDISKVSVVPSEPQAPQTGESISFLPGITDSFGFFTDIFLSNRGKQAFASDLNLYYTPFGSPIASSLLANVGKLPASIAAWFPFAPSSIFNVANQTGTIQVRTLDPAKLSFSALRGTVVGTNRYLTAMPVLKSDTAVAAGDRLVLSGVEKSATTHTEIYLQEAAGAGGAYNIEFFDANGAALPPNRTGTILPFGLATFSDVVPTGARSARVSNTSTGAARLTAYALVVDQSTLDSWTVVDSSRAPGATSDLVVPVPSLTGAPPSNFDLFLTNTSSSAASVTIGSSAAPGKRRAVKRGHDIDTDANDPPITLAAGETRRISLTNRPEGFVHISGPAGAISATGRLTTTVNNRPGAFGTGVPALPAARAASAGTIKRFARAGDFPNVSPATLLLLEATGRPATARVTVKFYFPVGQATTGQLEAAKDYAVGAGQIVRVPDIVRDVVGPSRDTLGVLSNLVVDVEVVSGEGKILSYLQTIDDSGDLTFSVD